MVVIMTEALRNYNLIADPRHQTTDPAGLMQQAFSGLLAGRRCDKNAGPLIEDGTDDD